MGTSNENTCTIVNVCSDLFCLWANRWTNALIDLTMENVTTAIEIVFENDAMLAIYKPSGIMVHGDGYHTGMTVADWFLEQYPNAQGVGEPATTDAGEPIERSGIVHRLDGETSGVLVLAKTQEAYEHLKKQFHDRLVRKEYRAFVYGTMKEQWGTINRPIGRSAKNHRMRSAQRGAKGTLRDAVTDWEVIGQSDTHAYLKLFPKTGRTHQIRVHLKAIGRPVVGDTMYAPEQNLADTTIDMGRLALHAYALDITLPDGVREHLIAPIPQEFEMAENSIAT